MCYIFTCKHDTITNHPISILFRQFCQLIILSPLGVTQQTDRQIEDHQRLGCVVEGGVATTVAIALQYSSVEIFVVCVGSSRGGRETTTILV